MNFAEGQYEKAILELKQFVQQAPTVPDPYFTLAMVYETLKDRAAALSFYHIAAALTPQDSSLWKRVGQMSWEEGDKKLALVCYNRAARIAPDDIAALQARAELMVQLEQHHDAGNAFEAWAQAEPTYIEGWIKAAENYHACEETSNVIRVLQMCIEKAFDAQVVEIGTNAVNMLADVFISEKMYTEGIDTIQAYHDSISQAVLPLDIAVKFGICHTYLGNMDLAKKMLKHL